MVEDGESIPTVALRSGHFWETIWDHPDNATLVSTRPDPNILVPGDQVSVPPLRQKQCAVATGGRYVYKRRGVPSRFSMQLFERGVPRANETYRLEFDNGRTAEGTLDANGVLDAFADATARSVLIFVGDDEECFELQIGTLRPIDTLEGVQQRLRNLGHYSGRDAGDADAIRNFQAVSGLTVTGDLDDATRAALAAAHDQKASADAT
ncbi:MAG TPA: peptidoglycan-binding domain-containing protein [Thermoanaerobaculia bacterium]